MQRDTKIALALLFTFVIGYTLFVLDTLPTEMVTYEREDVIATSTPEVMEPTELSNRNQLTINQVTYYLETKESPLSNHVDTLLEQEHWKLIVAISAIESSYCKRQLGNNCWGVTNTSGQYKTYASFDESIVDVNGLITRWQARGRWLSVDDLNGHYVVPANPDWVYLVNHTLDKLNQLSCHDHVDSNILNQRNERCL